MTNTIATNLASDILGLLVNGPNAPIKRIVQDGLLENDCLLAKDIQNQLAIVPSDSAEQVARIVSAYVGYILSKAVHAAQTDMGGR